MMRVPGRCAFFLPDGFGRVGWCFKKCVLRIFKMRRGGGWGEVWFGVDGFFLLGRGALWRLAVG